MPSCFVEWSDMNHLETDHEAYRRLKPEIDTRFPKGHFVAIDDGQVIADAPSYRELDAKLTPMRARKPVFFVVQAGDDMPKYVTIFL